jgi:hypothetical protein
MRTYWLRIVLGALGIFAVGMVVLTAVRATRSRVRSVAQTSDPITIPLPFVPFRIDGTRVGTFQRIVLNRDAPEDLRSVDLHVDLGDLAAVERIQQCKGILADLKHNAGAHGAALTDARFACVHDDSVQAQLEQFGQVHVVPGDRTVPLLVPPDMAAELRREMIQMRARRGDDSLAVRAESIATEAERTADSIGEAASHLADSITQFHERRADSIRRSALRRADSALRQSKQ